MAEFILWTIPSIVIGSIAMCILIYGGFLYLAKGREKEEFNERIVMFGYSGTLICFACYLIFGLTFFFFLPGSYRGNAFYVNFKNLDDFQFILSQLPSFFYFLGSVLFILVFELNYKRTRYVLTIIGILLIMVFYTMINMIGPLGAIQTIIWNLMSNYLIFFVLLIPILYAKWSQLEYRIVSSYIIMGYYCITWSFVFTWFSLALEHNFIPVWAGALLYCIGAIFMVLPILITHENISRTLMYSVVLNSFILGCQIFFVWILLSAGLNVIIMSLLGYTALFWYIQYTLLKSIKSYSSEQIPAGVEVSQADILGAFVKPQKPQKLTEEEVTISKEKKVCLVCKGKVGGYNFICTECGAFYCEKCAKTLTDMENACWVCNTPFDKSKPSKPFKKEEKEEIEIDEKMKGKSE